MSLRPRVSVLVFPGSNDDRDALRVAERVLGDAAVPIWHKDRDLQGVDCVILPGGFDSGQEIVIPVKNGEGCYVADEATLDALESSGRVVARYVGGNPNGSLRDIAGITNERGNVVGLMPHPEHAVEDLTGPGTDGLTFFTSVLKSLVNA